jgi:hypothetical protein
MPYLFLSYSKLDKDIAKTIRSLIQKEDCAVWMDENSRELTEQQWPVIVENIRNAALFILLVSEGAKNSAWVKRELDFAEASQKPILPILIDGTGWSRLEMPLETLEFGLSLDLSDSLKEKLKQLGLSPLPVELPPQIPVHTIDYKRERVKKSFRLWLGLMAAMIAVVFIFAPLVIALINRQDANLASTPSPQPSPFIMTLNSQESQTRESYLLQATEEHASDETAREENQQTRTHEQRNENRSATAIANTREVALVQESVRQNMFQHGTATQEVHLNETAIAGGGQLPCDATAVMKNGISRITLYVSPSLAGGIARLTRTGGEVQEFVITEWIVNEDGVWYRVGSSSRSSMGYVRPEELLLDANCPR